MCRAGCLLLPDVHLTHSRSLVASVILTEEMGKLTLRAKGFLTFCPLFAYVCVCLQRTTNSNGISSRTGFQVPSESTALSMSSQLPLVTRPPLPPWPGKEADGQEGGPLWEAQVSVWGGESREVMIPASQF